MAIQREHVNIIKEKIEVMQATLNGGTASWSRGYTAANVNDSALTSSAITSATNIDYPRREMSESTAVNMVVIAKLITAMVTLAARPTVPV
jgi:hypothetical protein